jgi:hypothetical protein
MILLCKFKFVKLLTWLCVLFLTERARTPETECCRVAAAVLCCVVNDSGESRSRKKYYRYYKRDYSGSGTRWLGGRSVATVLRWGARWYGQVNQVFRCVCVQSAVCLYMCVYVCVCVCVCLLRVLRLWRRHSPLAKPAFPPTRGTTTTSFPLPEPPSSGSSLPPHRHRRRRRRVVGTESDDLQVCIIIMTFINYNIIQYII